MTLENVMNFVFLHSFSQLRLVFFFFLFWLIYKWIYIYVRANGSQHSLDCQTWKFFCFLNSFVSFITLFSSSSSSWKQEKNKSFYVEWIAFYALHSRVFFPLFVHTLFVQFDIKTMLTHIHLIRRIYISKQNIIVNHLIATITHELTASDGNHFDNWQHFWKESNFMFIIF